MATIFSRLPQDSIPWLQNYDPTRHWWLSTFFAALPLLILVVVLIVFRIKAHRAALLALVFGVAIAVGIFHMPLRLGLLATMLGAGYGIFPIFWIIFPVFFLYELTVRTGRFSLLHECLVGVTEDSRLQLLLIAFSLGAFFEGAAGFGTPVAVCGTILIGLGFEPVQAAGLALLANTAPVAFGGLAIGVVALHGVTGLDTLLLGRVIATLLTPFCILVPFWLVWTFAGFRAMVEVWPAILVTGGSFAFAQLLIARIHGPWLVDVFASVISIAVLILFLRVWKPKRVLNAQRQDITNQPRRERTSNAAIAYRASLPWIILTLCVVVWGTPHFSQWLDGLSTVHLHVSGLDKLVFRVPPVVSAPIAEPAVFTLNWLSATGTGIFIAAWIAAVAMGIHFRDAVRVLAHTAFATRLTLVTIAALMGLGFLTHFCGFDATMGLALARTGALYPFFGPLVGWIGTASTGSDTASNVLFGGLQQMTAQQLGLSPYLTTAANASGGVMGKMIATQNVVVATTATGIYGKEGGILRFLILHSFALACLVGVEVLLLAHFPSIWNFILR